MSDILIETEFPTATDVVKAIKDAEYRGYMKAVEDRPQGEWIENDDLDGGYWHCSVCKTPTEAYAAFKIYPFCPFCGARMKGARDE